MRKLSYFVATSLDGYIAAPDGSFDAFSLQGDHVEALARDYPETLPAPALSALGVRPENRTFDTVLMGWNTYAVGLSAGLDNPYPHLRQWVCTRAHAAVRPAGAVTFNAEDPRTLVQRLKREPSARDIWLCGGGQLAAVLADEIDALLLKINPVRLGAGIPLFATQHYSPQAFALQDTRAFSSGVVLCRYSRVGRRAQAAHG